MRWIPPALTPVPPKALARATLAASTGRDDRDRLADLLIGRYEADDLLLTDSGTSALRLAMSAAVSHPAAAGRRMVALPAFSCFDLVTAARGAGVQMAFYDVDPDTLGPDWGSLEGTVSTGRVAAVVVAPLFGLPPLWDRIRSIASAGGTLLIEDAAQGFGASWRDRPVGSLGDWSVLSFARGKGWTGGGGGALLVRGAGRLGGARLPSRPRSPVPLLLEAGAQWMFGRPSLYGLPARIPALGLGETRYRSPWPPGPMAPISAALLLGSLRAAEAETDVRQQHARSLLEELEPAELTGAWNREAGYLRLPVRSREGLRGLPDPETARRLGILPSYPTPLPSLAEGPELDGKKGTWPGAATLARELLTLPTHSRVGGSGLARIASLAAGTRAIAGDSDPGGGD